MNVISKKVSIPAESLPRGEYCRIKLSERLAIRVTRNMARALAARAAEAGEAPSELARTFITEGLRKRYEASGPVGGRK